MNNLTDHVAGIFTLIIGVAILALLVSNKANTVGVIQAAASGFGNALSVAVSPVTGASVTPNLSYPSTATGWANLGGFGFAGY